MLKTADGVIGNEETYDDTCAFVIYIVNPVRNNTAIRSMGWMRFSITYTFSGLKRPGAGVTPIPKPLPVAAGTQ